MKKLVALPLIVAMSVAVTACAKQSTVDNAADANAVSSDETIADNENAPGDFDTDDNATDIGNAAGDDATLDANANTVDGNTP